MPKYNKTVGGYVISTKDDIVTNDANEGGEFYGDSHKDKSGGIKALIDNDRPILVESGEAILKKSAMESDKEFIVKGTPKEIASTLNQAFGGRAIGDEEAEIIKEFGLGGGISKPNFSKMSKAEIKEFYNSPEGKKLDAETYAEWKSLVNMTKYELKSFYDSKEGKEAGLSPSEAKEQGIDSGRESARWIMKMKDIPYTEWTDKMWIWAKKQIRFIKRMSGVKGDLYDDKGIKTPKHTALLIWGHNPEKMEYGGDINDNNMDEIKAIIEEFGLGGGIEREVPKYAMIDDEQFEVIGVNYDLDKVRVKNFASGETFEMPIDKWIIESFELGTPAKFKANGKEYSGEVVMRDGQKSISLYKDENYSGDAERIIPIREVDISTLKPTMKKEMFEDGGGIEFDLPKNEIQKGAEHEKEHLDTLEKVYEHELTPIEATKEVALDHISEIPDYYERLEEVEKPRTIKECLLSDNDDENDFLVEGTKVASNDGDNSQTWEVLSLNKDGLTLKHITKSVLSISLEDKYVSYSELRNMFSAGLISINGIDNLRMLNVCIKAVQNCIDKMDLMDHSSSLEKQLEAKEFIDEVKEMHENIDEVILKNGTHIDGEDLMETGGEVNGKNDIFEPSESQEEKERKIMEAQFGVDNI